VAGDVACLHDELGVEDTGGLRCEKAEGAAHGLAYFGWVAEVDVLAGEEEGAEDALPGEGGDLGVEAGGVGVRRGVLAPGARGVGGVPELGLTEGGDGLQGHHELEVVDQALAGGGDDGWAGDRAEEVEELVQIPPEGGEVGVEGLEGDEERAGSELKSRDSNLV